jgi:hypothetical protein
MPKPRTIQELATDLNLVEKETVSPLTQVGLYGKLLDELGDAARTLEDNHPLCMAYEALEKYARDHIKSLILDFVDYHGVVL